MDNLLQALPVAIIGAGPAGLMAAEALASHGITAHVFDAMPSVGRKFLLAGIGGLNLTHSDPPEQFLSRYGASAANLTAAVQGFDAAALRAWAEGLGIATFVGTSGRVFPQGMKAAPLLRAWLHRLRTSGVKFHPRHRWLGWGADDAGPRTPHSPHSPYSLRFATPHGETVIHAHAVVLALGGASWSKLGSDGTWQPWLSERGVAIHPMKPANCGFDVAGGWSEHLRTRFAGHALKPLRLSFTPPDGRPFAQQGECILTQTGLEGGLIYAASALLRDTIDTHGSATFTVDLLPNHDAARVLAEVSHPRGKRSQGSHLQSRLGLTGLKVALLHERLTREQIADPATLAAQIKALPITLSAARPLDEAISTAGGVQFAGLDQGLMLRALPGIFFAGEMLDWEAPTGGYLLTACFATGRTAGHAAAQHVAQLNLG